MNQPTKSVPAIPDRQFDVGNDSARRATDPVVAVAITVNHQTKNGTRTASGSAPIHEIPLMRRLYRALGGKCVPNVAWVPGIRRRVRLTHSQLQDELTRLSRTYVIPTEGGRRDIMAEVYGVTGAERLHNLRAKILQAHDAWRELENAAMLKIRASGKKYHPMEVESTIADLLVDKELVRLVDMLDPQAVAEDQIELSALTGIDLSLAPLGADAVESADGSSPERDEPSLKPSTELMSAGSGGARQLSPAEIFGRENTDEDGNPLPGTEQGDPDADLAPADLTEADVLIANMRQDGVEATMATRAALIIAARKGDDRGDALREAGFKGKSLASAIKRGKEFDRVSSPAPAPTA